jgi:hypothetical protein
MTITQLFDAYLRVPFATYASLTVTYLVVVYLFVAHMERVEAEDGHNAITYTRHEVMLRFAYPSLAGVAGAQSVLFAKCTIELISNSTSNGAMFLHYQVGTQTPYYWIDHHYDTYSVTGYMYDMMV